MVVGAGSAGAVVASRLSEVSNWTVLLLEAGGDENEISDIPSLSGYTQMSEMDWMYQTSPPGESPYCLAMIGDRCNWPRGKVRHTKFTTKCTHEPNLKFKDGDLI